MLMFRTANFDYLCAQLAGVIANGDSHPVGEWHAQKLPVTFLEAYNVIFEIEMPEVDGDLADVIKPNLPWAEDHFQERVSGSPLNPPPSASWWPFAQNGHEAHTEGGLFSHTYPERYWPKCAGDIDLLDIDQNRGIRYTYGDLRDVVNLLIRSPMTRQAYLPVWFPEDTGAIDNQRVPCSMGYHFWIRNGLLHCTYTLRSCDFYRHFRDDIYMTGRLLQWVCEEINYARSHDPDVTCWPPRERPEQQGSHPYIDTGFLNVHIFNLHALREEMPRLVQDATKTVYAEDGHVETDA